MLISRFEALGLLPDREYVIGYESSLGDDTFSRVRETLFETLSLNNLGDRQYDFGLYEPYGFVIFLHYRQWLTVSQRKAHRFIERFCDGKFERFVIKAKV